MSRRLARGLVVLVALLAATACNPGRIALRAGRLPTPDVSAAAGAAEAGAQAQAAMLLDQVVLPPGAVVTTAVTPGLDGPFAVPPVYPLSTPGLVDLHRLWSVPRLSASAAWQYVEAHPPAGYAPLGFGPSDRDGRTVFNYIMGPQGIPLADTRPLVAEEIVDVAGGAVLRADAQVIVLPPRTPGETATGDLVPSVAYQPGPTSPGANLTAEQLLVSDTAGAASLRDAFNALPTAAPQLSPSCQMDLSLLTVDFQLAFKPSGAPVIEATEDSCRRVSVRVNGAQAQELNDSGSQLQQAIISLLPPRR